MLPAWCTDCRRTYATPSNPHRQPRPHGKILLRLHVMNGFAGLPQQRSRRLAGIGSRGLEMSLSKVNVGHVAGQAVLIADQRQKNSFEVERKGVRSHCSQCVSWDATVFPSLNLCTQSLYSKQ